MTKRRAEGVIYHDSPHKRLCFRSLCNNNTALPALRVVQDADAPSLLSFLSSHCRKRNNFEDGETSEWSRSRKRSLKSKLSCTTLTDDENISGRFREACVRSSPQEVAPKKRPREETQQQGADHVRNVFERDDDLSTFNTFQFWRVPLPELDMSLLQNNESPECSSAQCTRDSESMET